MWGSRNSSSWFVIERKDSCFGRLPHMSVFTCTRLPNNMYAWVYIYRSRFWFLPSYVRWFVTALAIFIYTSWGCSHVLVSPMLQITCICTCV
jgi:hypothetical protein